MMDKTDRQIIRLLQVNGRITHEQISKEIHLSRPAVHDRIRRLEVAGIIRGYTVQVDWDSIGLPLGAFIFARIAGDCIPVAHQILQLGNDDALVQDCHRVAGDWCLLVQVRASTTATLQVLLDELRSLKGVQSTMTTIALSTVEADRSCALIPSQDPGTLVSGRN